jgi:hypothetical protein
MECSGPVLANTTAVVLTVGMVIAVTAHTPILLLAVEMAGIMVKARSVSVTR